MRTERINLTAAMPLLATRTLWMARVPPWPLTNQSSWEDMEAMRLGRPGARGVLWWVLDCPMMGGTSTDLTSLCSRSMDCVLGTMDGCLAGCSAAPLRWVFDDELDASSDAGGLLPTMVWSINDDHCCAAMGVTMHQRCERCSAVQTDAACIVWQMRLVDTSLRDRLCVQQQSCY